jgi:glutaredoxin 3
MVRLGAPPRESFVQPVVIYTKSTCPYCHAAKDLLKRKGAAFQEIGVDGDRAAQAAMAEKAGGRWTVPQIFIAGAPVGGCDDLYDLDAAGELDRLLAT